MVHVKKNLFLNIDIDADSMVVILKGFLAFDSEGKPFEPKDGMNDFPIGISLYKAEHPTIETHCGCNSDKNHYVLLCSNPEEIASVAIATYKEADVILDYCDSPDKLDIVHTFEKRDVMSNPNIN